MSNNLFADCIERRDKLQIYSDIIKVTNQETKITRILRLANIQYNSFRECIETLCGAGLLEKVESNIHSRQSQDMRTKYAYKATDLGKEWCKMVDDIYETLEGPF